MNIPEGATNSGSRTDAASGLDPARWVDEYGDYLFRFAVARVRDATLAQDLVQDTFLAALRAQGGFRGRASERTWLTGILKNKIVDHYRRSGRVSLINDLAALRHDQDQHFDEDGHWLINEPTAPRDWNQELTAHLDRDAFWKQFKECADKLPEQTRRAFIMREVDGLESEEVCATLQISANNFWTIMHRARSALRRCLEGSFFAPA